MRTPILTVKTKLSTSPHLPIMSKIFTSLPAPLNKITSNTFADNGNPGETPASISDINIYTPPIKKNIQYALFREYLYAHTAASLKEMQVIIKPENPFVFTGGYQEENVLSQPPVGFSFPGMANDANAELMSGLGFVKEKVANRTFYRGQLSDTSFQRIGLLRVNIDTPVPYGLTSVRGWITFGLCERIILNALKAIPKPLWSGTEQNIKYRGEYTSGKPSISNYAEESQRDMVIFRRPIHRNRNKHIEEVCERRYLLLAFGDHVRCLEISRYRLPLLPHIAPTR